MTPLDKMEAVEPDQPTPPARRRSTAGTKSAQPRSRSKPGSEELADQAPIEPEHEEPEREAMDEEEAVRAEPVPEFEPLEDDVADDGSSPARLGRSRRFGRVQSIGAAVALIVIAALVWSLITLVGDRGRVNDLEALQSLRTSALRTASTYGVYLSSYNYADLTGPTAPWTEVDQHSTPTYRSDFDKTKAALSKLVQDYKATASGQVKAEGISNISQNRAALLLYIIQSITNSTQSKNPTTQPIVVQLYLVRQHGEWLIDNLVVPK